MSATVAVQHPARGPHVQSHNPRDNTIASNASPRAHTTAASPSYATFKSANNNPTMSLSTPPRSATGAASPPASMTNGLQRHSPNEDERAALQIQQLSAASAAQAAQPLERKSPTSGGRIQHPPRGNSDPSNVAHSSSPSQLPIIKKEQPASPDPAQTSRTSSGAPISSFSSSRRNHRPKGLDLSNSTASNMAGGAPRPSASLTAKESATFAIMHDVGLACLSPGFQTHDPSRQEQLAKSMEMREQQRQIIEARLNKTVTKEVDLKAADPTGNNSFSKPRRKGPPPGLSIHAPEAHQFASEPRVVQSAPINHSFTGLKPAPAHEPPLSRQVLEHSHHHQHFRQPGGQVPHTAAQFGPISNDNPQTSRRLPPLEEVFNNVGDSQNFRQSLSRENSGVLYAPHNGLNNSNLAGALRSPHHPPPMHSPGFAPPSASLQPPPSGRHREFRSAEEAVQTLSGGREELLPKIIRYGGPHQAQPLTPPSPQLPGHHHHPSTSQPHTQSQSETQPYAHNQPPPQHEHTIQTQSQPTNLQYARINSHNPPPSASSLSYPSGARPDIGSRRRTREEFERDYADTERMDIDGDRDRIGHGRVRSGEWRDEAMAAAASRDREGEQKRRRRQQEKRDEFMALCARAWDLLHEC